MNYMIQDLNLFIFAQAVSKVKTRSSKVATAIADEGPSR